MTRHRSFPHVIPAGLVLVWLLVSVFVLASTTAVAQFNTGEIRGIVRDNSGGVLPGATVSVRHPASGLLIERITDTEGRFFFPALQIGQWDITAVLPGFALQTQKIVLEIGRTLNLEFTLGLEGLTERVTVESRAPLLQTHTAEISDVIENREVVQIPLNGRNFLARMMLCGRSRAMLKRSLGVALVVSCFGASQSPFAQSPTTVPGLVGSWALLNAERVDEGAPVTNARGLLIFDSAGHVVEVVSRGRRQPYAKNPPTPEEALGAFTTFGGFWGTYRADEKAGRIEYRPQGAVNPNLMDQELVRDYELKGDRLVITSRAGDLDVPGPTRSTWQRIPPIENLSPTYRRVLGFWQWVGERSVATATGATLTEGKRDPSVIVYAPSGLIGVHFVPANRKRLAGPTATPEEARASIAGYVGYTAALNVHPGEVIHHQLITINPGGGNLLRRSYEFVGNEIHLKFPPTTVQGQERQTQVTLRRLSGEAEMLGR